MQGNSVMLAGDHPPACECSVCKTRHRLYIEAGAVDAGRRFLRGLARRGAPNPRLINTCDGRGWLFWACARIALRDPVRARRIALAMTTGLENAMRWCWEHERGMRGGGCFDELAGLHARWMWMLNTGIWLGERGQPLVGGPLGEDEGAAIWRVTR